MSREWDNRNRWGVMDKCVQKLDKKFLAPCSRRPGIREKKPCPGSRELEESAKERDIVRDWSGKEGKTTNAGGVEE
ncbi:hypothetical protein TNCV_4285361 [Trichonephila clavipes]|nr:hypothetical protein TNCV_4285361 [Trichonephila clavipes]